MEQAKFDQLIGELTPLADQGDAVALRRLGDLRYQGCDGTPSNLGSAMSLWKRAADLGDADAASKVGAALIQGLGRPKDVVAGLNYLTMAAGTGHGQAQYLLGACHEKGIGYPADPVLARECYLKAAKLNDEKAQYRLGSILADAGMTEEAVYWLCCASSNGGSCSARAAARLNQMCAADPLLKSDVDITMVEIRIAGSVAASIGERFPQSEPEPEVPEQQEDVPAEPAPEAEQESGADLDDADAIVAEVLAQSQPREPSFMTDIASTVDAALAAEAPVRRPTPAEELSAALEHSAAAALNQEKTQAAVAADVAALVTGALEEPAEPESGASDETVPETGADSATESEPEDVTEETAEPVPVEPVEETTEPEPVEVAEETTESAPADTAEETADPEPEVAVEETAEPKLVEVTEEITDSKPAEAVEGAAEPEPVDSILDAAEPEPEEVTEEAAEPDPEDTTEEAADPEPAEAAGGLKPVAEDPELAALLAEIKSQPEDPAAGEQTAGDDPAPEADSEPEDQPEPPEEFDPEPTGKHRTGLIVGIIAVLAVLAIAAGVFFLRQSTRPVQAEDPAPAVSDGSGETSSALPAETSAEASVPEEPALPEEDPTPIPERVSEDQDADTPAETSSGEAGDDTGGYILPTSSSEYLTQEDLIGLTKEELRLARNEIYARNGYDFTGTDLEEYFAAQDWYTPLYSAEDFGARDTELLSEIELANLELIRAAENG